MPSHFSTIGFPVEYQSDYEALVVKALKHGSHIKVRSGSMCNGKKKMGLKFGFNKIKAEQLLV